MGKCVCTSWVLLPAVAVSMEIRHVYVGEALYRTEDRFRRNIIIFFSDALRSAVIAEYDVIVAFN